MTAELTPFPRESGNNLQRVFWQEFQLTPGRREQNKPGLIRN